MNKVIFALLLAGLILVSGFTGYCIRSWQEQRVEVSIEIKQIPITVTPYDGMA